MILASFYDKATGLLNGVLFTASDEAVVALNTPEGHAAIDGHHDHTRKRVNVDTKEVIDYQPPRPSADHEWNDESKRWQLTEAAADKIVRSNAARARIAQLEASQHRHVREHCLGMPGAANRLKEIDAEIAALRADL
jgi:hypothetical protein